MTLVTAWLLTYLLHSTLLLGAAALLRLLFRERGLALQEAVLRAALVGGLVTASLQIGLGIEPLGGRVHVAGLAAAPAEGAPTAAPLSTGKMIAGPAPEVAVAMRRGFSASPSPVAAGIPWRPVLFVAWTLAAVLGMARLGVGAARLRRLLLARAPVGDGTLGRRAAALARVLGLRAPVPLSAAPRLSVPLATGVLRPEVVLPTRALEELGEEAQVALCAHELAHLARRDPAWILVARGVESALPIQPLNTWARRRLQDLAECLSDDLAVVASGQPLGLARSLVDVASWTVGGPVFPSAVAAGALSTRSRLGQRVERLMDPLRSPERPRRLLLPLAVAAVAATALLTPVVSGSAPEDPADRSKADETKAETTTPESSARAEDLQRRIEEISARIASRADAHAAEREEIERIAESIQRQMPPPEEQKKLEADVEKAARALAEAQSARRAAGRSRAADQKELEEAQAEMRRAADAMREAMKGARLSAEDRRKMHEAARRFAEAARPTDEERAELRRLSRELAKETGSSEHLRREMEEMREELGRVPLEQVRESLRELRETIRSSTRESLEGMREALESTREATREATRELSRALDEMHPVENEDELPPPEPPDRPEAPEAPLPPSSRLLPPPAPAPAAAPAPAPLPAVAAVPPTPLPPLSPEAAVAPPAPEAPDTSEQP